MRHYGHKKICWTDHKYKERSCEGVTQKYIINIGILGASYDERYYDCCKTINLYIVKDTDHYYTIFLCKKCAEHMSWKNFIVLQVNDDKEIEIFEIMNA